MTKLINLTVRHQSRIQSTNRNGMIQSTNRTTCFQKNLQRVLYERRMSDTESTNHSKEDSNDGNNESSITSHLIEFQSHGEQSVEDKEPIAARFWLESLQRQYPKSFKRVCLKNRYTYVKRFTPEKSYSIMWIDLVYHLKSLFACSVKM